MQSSRKGSEHVICSVQEGHWQLKQFWKLQKATWYRKYLWNLNVSCTNWSEIKIWNVSLLLNKWQMNLNSSTHTRIWTGGLTKVINMKNCEPWYMTDHTRYLACLSKIERSMTQCQKKHNKLTITPTINVNKNNRLTWDQCGTYPPHVYVTKCPFRTQLFTTCGEK